MENCLKHALIKISYFLIFIFLAPLSRADLVTDYPQNETFALQSGKKILLPMIVGSNDSYFLTGTANLGRLNSLLKHEDLRAIPLSDSHGLIGVYVIHYKSSSIGPYNEVVILANAEAIPNGTIERRQGFFVIDIKVDTKLALEVGREVWGFPKTLGESTLNMKSSDINFVVKDENGQENFSGKCNGCLDLNFTNMANDLRVITPYKIRRSWVSIKSNAPVATKAFEVGRDVFSVNPHSKIGHTLKDLEFVPANWLIGRDGQMVIFK